MTSTPGGESKIKTRRWPGAARFIERDPGSISRFYSVTLAATLADVGRTAGKLARTCRDSWGAWRPRLQGCRLERVPRRSQIRRAGRHQGACGRLRPGAAVAQLVENGRDGHARRDGRGGVCESRGRDRWRRPSTSAGATAKRDPLTARKTLPALKEFFCLPQIPATLPRIAGANRFAARPTNTTPPRRAARWRREAMERLSATMFRARTRSPPPASSASPGNTFTRRGYARSVPRRPSCLRSRAKR